MTEYTHPDKDILSDRSRDCIIVFMRAPEIGKVKSRLEQSLGPDAALALYQCFVGDILATAASTNIETRIFYYPIHSKNRIVQGIGNQYDLLSQTGKDLGERMANALLQTFAAGYRQAILIGTDCPEMTPHILRNAFQGIEQNGSVLGPSMDGGYYLIGFAAHTYTDQVFQGINWGSEKVCRQTLKRFRQMDMEPHRLPVLNDIDTAEDLKSFYQKYSKKKNNSRTIRYLLQSRMLDR